jgi:Na+/proline symporter
MMQKNISCKTLGEAQKNVFSFSVIIVIVNILFLSLGVLLYEFARAKGIEIPAKTDDLFPIIALEHLGTLSGIFFIIGLISAAYPSADGALTALTTSFSIDFLNLKERTDLTEKQKIALRHTVHIGFAVVLLLVIVLFRIINNDAVINNLFTWAGYTYGPLLGLFAFGVLTKYSLKDKMVPLICLLSPVLCYYINLNSERWFNGYKFGFELLILNGLLTFIGLFFLANKRTL